MTVSVPIGNVHEDDLVRFGSPVSRGVGRRCGHRSGTTRDRCRGSRCRRGVSNRSLAPSASTSQSSSVSFSPPWYANVEPSGDHVRCAASNGAELAELAGRHGVDGDRRGRGLGRPVRAHVARDRELVGAGAPLEIAGPEVWQAADRAGLRVDHPHLTAAHEGDPPAVGCPGRARVGVEAGEGIEAVECDRRSGPRSRRPGRPGRSRARRRSTWCPTNRSPGRTTAAFRPETMRDTQSSAVSDPATSSRRASSPGRTR